MTMTMTNREIVRTIITTPDVGTPGAGLKAPDQFDAFHNLAEELFPWLAAYNRQSRKPHTGNLTRTSYGKRVIQSSTQAVGSPNLSKPAYDRVSYDMQKMVVQFQAASEVGTQSADPGHIEDVVNNFMEAFGRSLHDLLWLGDTTSADAMLAIFDGWLKKIVAGGNTTNGALINGGVLSDKHFYSAVASLPTAWQQRRRMLKWAIGTTHMIQLENFLSGRATGFGDEILKRGTDGTITILGIESIECFSLTTDLVLVDPRNTVGVFDRDSFTLESVTEGLEVKLADIIAWVGHIYGDAILPEVEGSAVVQNLVATFTP
jgi:hypothetical protein